MQFVLNELKSARQFVDVRRRHTHQVDISQILSSFADNITKKINNNSLTASEISTIMDELQHSPYSEEQTNSLIKLLDKKCWKLCRKLIRRTLTASEASTQLIQAISLLY